MGRETERRHLLVKSQCFAQFGRRSAACTLMFHNIIHWQGHVKRISPELRNREKWDERDMHIYL